MKLSIVIPVYNVEKYIAKCLLSCINQDILASDYEIIVVNDGTPDNSMEIVKGLAKSHSNIHVLNQQNQGLSAARNNGFAIAKGEYVWFVDSDDWIEENCLKRISNLLTNNLDILQLQYRLTYDDSSLNKDVERTIIDGVVNGESQTLVGGLPAPAQFSIYRAEFLRKHNLKFVRGIYHEDSEFKPRAVYLAETITSDNIVSYNYYQRQSGSITSSFSIKRANDIIYVCNSLYDFSQNLPSSIKKCFYSKIALNLNSLIFGYKTLPNNEQEQIRDVLKMNKHLLHCMTKSNSIKYKIEGIIFSVNISLGIALYNLFKHN